MERRAEPLPIWAYPFVLALLGIVLYVGRLSTTYRLAIGGEGVLYLGYLRLRSRRSLLRPNVVANLLALFPGHLLLLFALGLLPGSVKELVFLWMVIPVMTVFYDIASLWFPLAKGRRWSILAGLYCIIWADLFFLLERVIVVGRGWTKSTEIPVAMGFGAFGGVFLVVGVYRHWRLSHLIKE
jgi:hypothetical protein